MSESSLKKARAELMKAQRKQYSVDRHRAIEFITKKLEEIKKYEKS